MYPSSSSSLLSGRELFQYKLANQEMKKQRRKKKKDIHEDEDDDEGIKKRKILPKDEKELQSLKDQVNKQLKEQFGLLGCPRVRHSQEMGLVEWLSDHNASRLIQGRKKPSWMGFSLDGKSMLTPEETLFLLENECIIVNHCQLPVSREAAYQLMIQDETMFRCYRVYSYLTRLGYKVRPFRGFRGETSKVTTVKNKESKSNREEIAGKDDEKSPALESDGIEVASQKLLNNEANEKTKALQILSHQEAAINEKSKIVENSSPSTEGRADVIRKKLNTKPLRRNMFLEGTSFARPSSWNEYERIQDDNCEKEEMVESEAIVVELDLDLMQEPGIFNQLPIADLVDQESGLKPLIDQTKIMKIDCLQDILKKNGPQGKNLLPPSTSSKHDIRYEVYLPTRKSLVNQAPEYYLIVCDEHQYPPSIQDLMATSQRCAQSRLLFAVFTQTDFSIYTLQPFEYWDEIPVLWDSSMF